MRSQQLVLSTILLLAAAGCSSGSSHRPAVRLSSTQQALGSAPFEINDFVLISNDATRKPEMALGGQHGFLVQLSWYETDSASGFARFGADGEQLEVTMHPDVTAEGAVNAWLFDGSQYRAFRSDAEVRLQADPSLPLFAGHEALQRSYSSVACALSGTCLGIFQKWHDDTQSYSWAGQLIAADGSIRDVAASADWPSSMRPDLLIQMGGQFRTFWRGLAADTTDTIIYTARLDEQGRVVEAPRVFLDRSQTQPSLSLGAVLVAVSGERALMMYSEYGSGAETTYGVPFDVDGNLLSAPQPYVSGPVYAPQLTGTGGTFLLSYGDSPSIGNRLQVIDANGKLSGDPFFAQSADEKNLTDVRIAADAESYFVVGNPVSGVGTYTQVFDPQGVARGPAKRLWKDRAPTNNPQAVWNGSHYLVAWDESGEGGTRKVRFVRITAEGTVLDRPALDLTGVEQPSGLRVMASNGASTLLLLDHYDASGEPDALYTQTVDVDGKVSAPRLLVDLKLEDGISEVNVASSGSGYMLAYTTHYCHVYVAPLDSDGAPLSPIHGSDWLCAYYYGSSELRVQWTGSNYWVTWEHHGQRDIDPMVLYGMKVSPDGTSSEAAPISDRLYGDDYAAACGAGECLLVWYGRYEDQGLMVRRFSADGTALSPSSIIPWSDYVPMQVAFDGKAFFLSAANNDHLATWLWPGGLLSQGDPVALAQLGRILASNGQGQTLLLTERDSRDSLRGFLVDNDQAPGASFELPENQDAGSVTDAGHAARDAGHEPGDADAGQAEPADAGDSEAREDASTTGGDQTSPDAQVRGPQEIAYPHRTVGCQVGLHASREPARLVSIAALAAFASYYRRRRRRY